MLLLLPVGRSVGSVQPPPLTVTQPNSHPSSSTPPPQPITRHLPERWGYAYFTEKGVNHTSGVRSRSGDSAEEGPRDPLWPVKEALSQVYEAEKIYDALYGTHGVGWSVGGLVFDLMMIFV